MAAGRSLWPREHGAYAQLLAPLATSLILRAPTLAAGLLAAAACCAFLANEPLLVLLGHRGPRMRERHARPAAVRLGLAAAGALAGAAAGLALAPPAVWPIAALAATPALLLIVLAWRRSEHSLVGELAAAVALPGAAAPVAVAASVDPCTARLVWVAWSIGYACTVVAVHRVIARHRKPAATWADHAIAIALLALVAGGAVLAREVRPALLALPLALAAAVLVLRPPSARRLRAIGVALVVASLVSGSLAVALV